VEITRQFVAEKLLAYLNHTITLPELVDWAENTFIDDALVPDADVEMLNDILSYLAAIDTPQFPLTWEHCADFLEKLGVKVKIVTVQE
jgi:hypothetical protein